MTAGAIGAINTGIGAGFNMSTATGTNDVVVTVDDALGAVIGTATVTAGSTVQEAVDAINGANISGVTAFEDGGQIRFLSTVGDINIADNGGGAGAAANTLGFSNAGDVDSAVDANYLDGVGVDTVTNANFAVARVDEALTTVNGLRGNLGAIQNRFESTIVNLQTVSENLAASRGRIQDADFAAETANLTKAQILQQAGVSVLSQANAQPQLALSLLQ